LTSVLSATISLTAPGLLGCLALHLAHYQVLQMTLYRH
jgi:hypothetical protein